MYEMKIVYQDTDMILYSTRDCSFLFTSRIDMNATPGTRSNPQPAAPPIKTVRPVVDLYVMAFCPYGTQAESAMKPVVALLGSKADIRVRYITTVTGTTVSSVQSLHGMPEVKEDLRQICILNKNPEQFWDYVSRFNEACYSQSQNADRLDACWRNVTAAAGIDTKSIESCATGEEGLALLKADEALSGRDRADSSPTLVINGQEYTGSRTPDAYKQAICDRFEAAPAECSTILPPVQGAVAGGNCG
jgi:glutaredoxin